jgi:glycosyltransferase involved in cell wall biosynthesis
MEASVIIPAYNEEKNIEKAVKRVRAVSKGYEIIVVDDGSSDRTGYISRKAGARVIRLGKNQGKASACLAGAGKAGCEKVVFIDADLQLKPEEIPKFVRALDDCDLAVGIREMKKVPLQRRLSNSIAAKLVGGKDVLCGFRGVKKAALSKMKIKSRRYEFEAEMILAAKKKGLRIKEVPVSVSYESYRGMGIADSLRVLIFILKKRLEK